MKKVGFVSLGCPKNLVDSEVMMGYLKQNGYEITADAAEADTVVVNTCGFIDSAKQESIDAILEAARLKTEGQAQRLVVAGCLVERYRDELKAEMPEVDAFIGTSQISDILAVCDPKTNTRALPVVPIGNQSATYLYDESTPRVLATPSHYAFVKIAEGCDRPCAFCFIPQMRGHFRSRRFGSIVAEAHQLAEEGVKELILVAQDSSRYGEDLGKQDAVARLLRELSHTDGIEWVRVMYTYPTHISDAFLDVLAEEPKAVKYLDMPLQHASRNVLKLMKRGGNRASLERLIERVRRRVPDIAVRTTFITGFPGETEDDFKELLAFVKNVEFDRVGVFTYSDEEGTPAFALPNKVPQRIAARRQAALMKKQARISQRKNNARIGDVARVLFEGESKESDLLWQGRMETQAPDIDGCVLINDVPDGVLPEPGDFVRVEITEAHQHDLIGRILALSLPVKESSDELNPSVVVSPAEVPAPRPARTGLDYAALAIATFGVGYLPLIPGTFGSMVGAGIFLILQSWPLQLAFIAIITVLGVWAASQTERILGLKDPGKVVVDEVAGQMIAMLPISLMVNGPWVIWVIVSFNLFRLFDIFKPYPAGRLEHLRGGFGIMADDLVAGLYAAIGTAIFIKAFGS